LFLFSDASIEVLAVKNMIDRQKWRIEEEMRHQALRDSAAATAAALKSSQINPSFTSNSAISSNQPVLKERNKAGVVGESKSTRSNNSNGISNLRVEAVEVDESIDYNLYIAYAILFCTISIFGAYFMYD
jgi:hypothetical protein